MSVGTTPGDDGPAGILEHRATTPPQIAALAIMVLLNALDGFDVLSISYASPGIAREWHLGPAALGVVLSMELAGMAVGSITLGSVTDRIGRRRTILGCLVLMAAGMVGAALASGVIPLSAARLFTGLGIGGMLAATNAATAELANARVRTLALSLMVIGYPLGSVIGGTISSLLLAGSDWRSVFVFGAVATGTLIPLVWLLVPETPAFLARRRSGDALARLNTALGRLGHDPVAAMSAARAAAPGGSLSELFGPDLIATTCLMIAAYFAHIISFYFVLKWAPKIVVDMGFAPSAAGHVLVWASLGGATGGALLGLLSTRFGLKRLTLMFMGGSTVALIWFGHGAADLRALSIAAAIAGVTTNAAVAGLYAMAAHAFPTHLRGTGTGLVIGIGRAGAVLAPVLAGLFFQVGYRLGTVATVMSLGSFIAAIAISRIKLR